MKINRLRTIFVVALALCLGWDFSSFSQSRRKAIGTSETTLTGVTEPEDFAVYNVILESLYRKNGTSISVIDKETSGCVRAVKNAEGARAWQQSLDALPRKMPALSPVTIGDFKRKLQVCHALLADNFANGKVILLERSERQKIFTGQNVQRSWQQFQQKFPSANGYINFSNVGWNADRTQALVNTYRKCGEKCGAEYMVLLAKVYGKWNITATHKIWEL